MVEYNREKYEKKKRNSEKNHIKENIENTIIK